MDWRTFPSLAGLRAFETVARRGTYSAAARDLNVTEAAIRQHMRGLEEFLGHTLATREGRGIGLTETGAKLAKSVSAGFQTIHAGIEELQADAESRPLKIALTPAFAENWLMPRLGQFWSDHPDVEIELAPSLKVADLKGAGIDLAIRYGHGHWPGCRSDLLASAEYVVVATQGFMRGLGTSAVSDLSGLADLQSCSWLFETGRLEHQRWTADRGIDFHAARNRFYPTNSLVLSAARAGHGLSLQSRALVERDLQNGHLVEVYFEDPGTLAYYIVTLPTPRGKTTLFERWLKNSR